jgi:hypothetical protein
MSFASGTRELRRDILTIPETHITLLLVLCLGSLMDLTIAHKVLVHERTIFCLDTLVTDHVLIVVIVSRVGPVFLLDGLTLIFLAETLGRSTFSPSWLTSHSVKW